MTILNQLTELIAFVQSVQAGSFSSAARILGTTPSAVSKRVAKLEDQLGVRLLQRTTRSLNLTMDGTTYYERVVRLLAELEEANDVVMSRMTLGIWCWLNGYQPFLSNTLSCRLTCD